MWMQSLLIVAFVAARVTMGLQQARNDSASGEPGFRAGWLDLEKEGKTMPLGVTSGGGNLGIDISQPLGSSTASCLVNQGYGKVLIPRAFLSTGRPDTAACGSLQSGRSAGFQNLGVYMFPCPQCGPASSQVKSLVDYLNGCSAFSGKIWLDIEGSQYWLGSSSANRAWYQNLVDSCTNSRFSCGVYASYYQWQEIFGSVDYEYGSYLPLWYAHYDGQPNFNDYSSLSFGGFTPFAKQYRGDATVCSFGVDLNYYPH